jgi:hypothetical protein
MRAQRVRRQRLESGHDVPKRRSWVSENAVALRFSVSDFRRVYAFDRRFQTPHRLEGDSSLVGVDAANHRRMNNLVRRLRCHAGGAHLHCS